VLTHHSVLQALLGGQMSVDEAAGLGLLAFSGSDTDTLRSIFASGLHTPA
jgi:hypothetical protein